MTQTQVFIRRLDALGAGDLAELRCQKGQTMDQCVRGFDLFAGLWWPLRERNPSAPRRETSWLVAKLFASYRMEDTDDSSMTLARRLGQLETLSGNPERFRHRFDALLQAQLATIEPHLRWALSRATGPTSPGQTRVLNWARLLDDLSIWDRGTQHRYRRDVREIWATEYLRARDE